MLKAQLRQTYLLRAVRSFYGTKRAIADEKPHHCITHPRRRREILSQMEFEVFSEKYIKIGRSTSKSKPASQNTKHINFHLPSPLNFIPRQIFNTNLHPYLKMKPSFIWLTALITLAYAMPVDESSAHAPAKAAMQAKDRLMKRQCGSSGCPCNEPLDSFCTDSCFCQTACCNSQTALCQDLPDVIASGGFCVGGSSG